MDVDRFDRATRIVHLAHAALFAGLVGTGFLLLFFPSIRAIALGPYRVLPLVHTALGLAMSALFLSVAIHRACEPLRRDVRAASSWRWRDARWLVLAPISIALRGSALPAQPRFNAGQRLNILFTIATTALLGVTGLILWSGRLVTYRIQEPAYEIHFLIALAVSVVALGHTVVALTHPGSLRGIIAGRVSEQWASRHHAEWAATMRPVPRSADRGE